MLFTYSPIHVYNGTTITIVGKLSENPDHFKVQLLTSLEDDHDVAVTVSIKFDQDDKGTVYVKVNEKSGRFTFQYRKRVGFVLAFVTGPDELVTTVNTETFPFKLTRPLPVGDIKRLRILEEDGDCPTVQIMHVSVQV